VKARSFSYYLLAFQGANAIGALCLGGIAQASSASTAFLVLSGGLVLSAIATWPLAIPAASASANAMSEPLPLPAVPADLEHGPVLVTVEYALAPSNVDAFLAIGRELRGVRRRTGALRWHLHRDLEDRDLFIETFLVGSWEEHERQHARLAAGDHEVLARIDLMLRPGHPRSARHAVGIRPPRRPASAPQRK